MGKLSTWTLLAVFSLLVVKGICEDLDLSDALDDKPPTSAPKVEPAGGDVKPTTKRPVQPTVPVKNPVKPKPKQTAGGFSNDDLADIGNDNTYKPDKGKGKGGQGTSGNDLEPADENNYDTMAETGTIAGIISAVGMALVGAVSGYISYQKKKLCFSIQQSLNTDMVKADAPDAVVAQEPQVQQTLLQPPNAEPPTEENAV
ncbi:CD99 antigen-like protein 2 isoform X5 [Triplophysa rosa]|uniref:CD99 antigen-like protein 2 isoform X5 n=1 Tax=Triplophysa rosa TaxID=992332 RepID=UPI002545D505|nr:CD99 antigen-like protein 2 isoform X5 [Triplophysa rosa]